METFGRWRRVVVGLLALTLGTGLIAGADLHAQLESRATEGFDVTLDATATGEELSRQSDMWVMEVSFKPMRMIRTTVTDPETGEQTSKLVWYLVYKAVNRPLPKREVTADRTPVNAYDTPPQPYFVPEFTLVTRGGEEQHVYSDVILPEAQAAIIERERRRLKNSVGAVQPVPGIIPKSSVQEEDNTIYGVAMWTGVDPETDFFTVFMEGFSNGYRAGTGPDGESLTEWKTIRQEYWRPGDQFDETEEEFRREGKPEWIYRPQAPGNPLAEDASANSSEKPQAEKQQ